MKEEGWPLALTTSRSGGRGFNFRQTRVQSLLLLLDCCVIMEVQSGCVGPRKHTVGSILETCK